MPRVISFVVLLGIVLIVGMVFFQVMAQFIVPLFLACVLLVMFQPLHAWVLERLSGRTRLSAMVTTLLILLIVLLPLCWLGWKAYVDTRELVAHVGDRDPSGEWSQHLHDRAAKLLTYYEEVFGRKLDTESMLRQAVNNLGAIAVKSVQIAVSVLVGFAIMLIALYYFLADGPAMIRTLMRLSPLDSAYEAQLLDQFSHLSRSVVVAMLLSAVVQGSFAGVGYYFALPAGAPVFLMTALTMILALVPFVGTAVMWVPTCAWLLLFGPVVDENNVTHFSGNWGLAIGLAAYCAVFVSLSDNLIKPLVLQGRANLHPLLALLSILGGVQVLGPVGILVGPMLVSFLQALLEMLHKELDAFAGEGGHGEKLLAEVGAAPRFANEAAGTASGSGPESAASPAKPAPASRRRKK